MREIDPVQDAWDDIAQRFIDNDLSREERVQLLARLGHDEPLRQRLVDLEQLTLDAAELPRPQVPAGFVGRVLDAVVPEPSGWNRLTMALWAPRTLRWNVARAVGVAALFITAVGGAYVLSSRGMFVPEPSGERMVDGPSTSGAVLVRLIVLQPGAQTVHVAGDFNGWTPSRTPLEPTANGAWAVTIALEPGRYEYQFVVDDQQWVADPFAAELNDDGFGSRNAVLDVRRPDGAL